MKKIIRWVAGGLAAITVGSCGAKAIIKGNYCHQADLNSKKYASEIDEYNQFVKEYAAYVNSLELTDMEIFLKVIKDIWEDIDGYGYSKNLLMGYQRLSFQEEGVGHCQCFADDFTARINAINPDYDAKNVIVYVDDLEDDKTYNFVSIETKYANYGESMNETDFITSVRQKINGNHMVTLLRINSQNLYLMVDPTNLLFGVFQDGKIYMLNTDDEDFFTYKVSSSNRYSTESTIDYYNDYINCFSDANISCEQIEVLYGFEAQKKALENVDEIDIKVKRMVKLR